MAMMDRLADAENRDHVVTELLAGRCKTWTLDSGLDRGLDCVLEFGLEHA